jgi:predicted phosphodiesterase
MATNARHAVVVGLVMSACGGDDAESVGDAATSTADSSAGPATDPTVATMTATPTASADDGSSSATLSAGTADDSSSADASSSAESGESTGGPPAGATPENLRVAFFGDHGLGSESVSTLELVISEDADFLVILGDFDYGDDPEAWHAQLDEGLGTDFPMFAVAGNHDEAAWDGYRQVLMDRLTPIADAQCEGEIGIQMNCQYQGVDLVLSGVGTMDPPGDQSHEAFITEQLGESEQIWKFCAWHKNQNDMQVGDKGNEVGWEAYQACQNGGAIVATGHEHSYSRTKTLTDLGNVDAGHGAMGEHGVLQVGLGSTFVFVAGMGGVGIRDYEADQHDDDTWWSTIYTSDRYIREGEEIEGFEVELGVMFIDFYVDGDPYKAHAYFKNLTGEVIDEFDIFAAEP